MEEGIITASSGLRKSEPEIRRIMQRQAAYFRKKVLTGPVPLVPRVNHGRWQVMCPCGAGVLADPDWQYAYCTDCATQHPVAWEPKGQRKKLARVLVVRPDKRNRNWFPGESEKSLKAENKDHKLPEQVADAAGGR